LLKLDAERALNALGAAATQTAGLTASFGTMAKPFHAGKAAMDGIVAAQLAASGFEAATGLFEPGGGLDNALVQDQSAAIAPVNLAGWRILDNSFKPYAACHLTHPAVDAARALAPGTNALAALTSARIEVGGLANQITGGKSGNPATPLEGKFDLKYCIALGLHGHDLSAADFREPWRPDPALSATAQKVAVSVSPEMGFASSRLSLEFADGRAEGKHVPIAKGHPGNPMNWGDMQVKFAALTAPYLGSRGDTFRACAGVRPQRRASRDAWDFGAPLIRTIKRNRDASPGYPPHPRRAGSVPAPEPQMRAGDDRRGRLPACRGDELRRA